MLPLNRFNHFFTYCCIPVKDCNPADGPPCTESEHTEMSVPMYDTVEACCGRLDWIDIGTCVAVSDVNITGLSTLRSDLFFGDADSSSCLQDCESGNFRCANAPPSVTLYDSIDACCSGELWWTEYKYCTSRSIGGYSDGWIVDFQNEKCGESNHSMLRILVCAPS